MEISYQYSKSRASFGHDVRQTLQDAPTSVLLAMPSLPPISSTSTSTSTSTITRRNPCSVSVSTIPQMSAHTVNTERCVLKSTSMRHVEGGWPKDVDPTEQADVTRFRKKAEKDDEYKAALKVLGPLVSRCMKQNGTVDIYEEYFVGGREGGREGGESGGGEGIGETGGFGTGYGGNAYGGLEGGGKSPIMSGMAGKGGGITITSASSGSSSGSYNHSNHAHHHQQHHASEPLLAKGLAVFRDPSPVKRPAIALNWHPEGQGKLAVAYCGLGFQDPRFTSATSKSSYIWDIHSPNRPELELCPPSPLTSLRFNPKSPDTLLGGCQNGLVCFFDLRRQGGGVAGREGGREGVVGEASFLECSHHDPVRDVFWISSKTGHQCVSISTDGRMLWWDTRRLAEPTDDLPLSLPSLGPSPCGATALDYSLEGGPTKYLIGTEQGLILSLNLRNRRQQQQQQQQQQQHRTLAATSHTHPLSSSSSSSTSFTAPFSSSSISSTNCSGLQVSDPYFLHKHHGAILSLQRNPAHPKFYLTIGDWRAALWTEDLRSPIFTTPFLSSPLMAGCWSPTRPGVFFVARKDGMVEGWDLLSRQGERAFAHKVGDTALTSLAIQGPSSSTSAPCNSLPEEGKEGGSGRLMAVGDEGGTVALLELCAGLSDYQAGEKAAVGAMLDRAMRAEKYLEVKEREGRRAKTAVAEEGGREGGRAGEKESVAGREEKMEELLRKVDADFLSMIKDAEDDEAGGRRETEREY
ncbi:hypothetical protein VYU27_009794 [Nannochloropsis oceanica]